MFGILYVQENGARRPHLGWIDGCLKWPDTPTELDFSKPILSGEKDVSATYVNIGTYFNNNTTAAQFVSKVIFPEHFKFICTRSFYGCSNLASFWTLDSTTGERVKGRFPAQLDRIGDNVFTGCSFSDMACDLYFPGPTQIDDNPGFPGKDYTAIRFGPSFRSVGNGAFENCTNLQSVVFEEPTTVTKIGSSAFKGCTSLSSFSPFLPASLTYIGQSAFAGDTALELDLYITNGVTSLNWEPADIQNTFLDDKKLTVTNHVNVAYLDSWKTANPNVGRVPVSWTNGSEQWIVRWNPYLGLKLIIR